MSCLSEQNWMPSIHNELLNDIMSDTTTFEVTKHGINPYWESYKRGRPTEAQRRKRVLYHTWNKKHRELYPEMQPSLSFLLDEKSKSEITVTEGKVRSVKIVYEPRQL